MNNGQVWRALVIATSYGFTVALLTAAGVLGGRWLDHRAHTEPLFTVIGLFLGLGAGVAVFVREVGRLLGDPRK